MMKNDDPPAAHLPSERLRMLTVMTDVEAVVAQQVGSHAQLLGSYQRPWHPGPGS